MVAGCCVCYCDFTRIPSNEYDKEQFEEVAERRAGVKRSETEQRRKFADPSCRARLGEAQYKREPQHCANKEADVERAGSKTVRSTAGIVICSTNMTRSVTSCRAQDKGQAEQTYRPEENRQT